MCTVLPITSLLPAVGCKTEDGFTVIFVERGPGVETNAARDDETTVYAYYSLNSYISKFFEIFENV